MTGIVATEMAGATRDGSHQADGNNEDWPAASPAVGIKQQVVDQKKYCQAIVSYGRATQWQVALQVLTDSSSKSGA